MMKNNTKSLIVYLILSSINILFLLLIKLMNTIPSISGDNFLFKIFFITISFFYAIVLGKSIGLGSSKKYDYLSTFFLIIIGFIFYGMGKMGGEFLIDNKFDMIQLPFYLYNNIYVLLSIILKKKISLVGLFIYYFLMNCIVFITLRLKRL